MLVLALVTGSVMFSLEAVRDLHHTLVLART
jgi:hypothetical protein